MEIKKVNAYITECGKKYWSRSGATKHEGICNCWSNPNFKTCVSCVHGKIINDTNGMESEPQFLQTWMQWECSNADMDFNKDFTQAPNDKTESLCINCPHWEQK